MYKYEKKKKMKNKGIYFYNHHQLYYYGTEKFGHRQMIAFKNPFKSLRKYMRNKLLKLKEIQNI